MDVVTGPKEAVQCFESRPVNSEWTRPLSLHSPINVKENLFAEQ